MRIRLTSLFIVLGLIFVIAGESSGQTIVYSVTDLGDLPRGVDRSTGNSINSAGVVAGTSHEEAFIWDDAGGISSIGFLPGGLDISRGHAINDLNQIVGMANTSTGTRAFFWDSTAGMVDIGELPGGTDFSWANDINNLGQVVGRSIDASSSNQAFIWDSVNGMSSLGTLPGSSSSIAWDINNNSQVVGTAGDRAFLWETGTGMADLGVLPGAVDSSAFSISDNGVVVGSSELAPVSGNTVVPDRAFRWTSGGGMVDLGELAGGNDFSIARAVNETGFIVGESESSAGRRAVVWDNGNAIQDLNSLLDSTGVGWVLEHAWDINDAGQIVGEGINPDGSSRGFLLTPSLTAVPEPGSISVLALALIALGFRRKRATDQ